MFEKIPSNNNLLENKVEQIQKDTFRLLGKQMQVEEEEININSVFVTFQKEVNLAEKQTTRNPDQHPNYKKHFDQ